MMKEIENFNDQKWLYHGKGFTLSVILLAVVSAVVEAMFLAEVWPIYLAVIFIATMATPFIVYGKKSGVAIHVSVLLLLGWFNLLYLSTTSLQNSFFRDWGGLLMIVFSVIIYKLILIIYRLWFAPWKNELFWKQLSLISVGIRFSGKRGGSIERTTDEIIFFLTGGNKYISQENIRFIEIGAGKMLLNKDQPVITGTEKEMKEVEEFIKKVKELSLAPQT